MERKGISKKLAMKNAGNMYITWKDQFGFDLYEEYEDEKAENLHYSAYTFFKK